MADSTSTKRKRKSKWDEPASTDSPTSSSNEDASVSAACAAARINAMLEAQGKLKKGVVNSDVNTTNKLPPPAEIEINDSEARGVLTKGPTLNDISKSTGAVVSVKGRLMSLEEKANSAPNDRPLYLWIQAPNQAFINAAVQKIRKIMYDAESGKSPAPLFLPPPPPPTNPQPSSSNHFLQDKVYVGLDDINESFPLLQKLRGPEDSFLTHIINSSGAKVFLRGRGSGYMEPLSGRESFEALYIYISHPNSEGLMSARRLCESLINHVKREYETFMSSRVYQPQPFPHQPHPYQPHPFPPQPHHFPPHPAHVGGFHRPPQAVHPEHFAPRPHPFQPHPPPHQAAVAPPPPLIPPQVNNNYYEPHHHTPRPMGPRPPFQYYEFAPPPQDNLSSVQELPYHQLSYNGSNAGPHPPHPTASHPPGPPAGPPHPIHRPPISTSGHLPSVAGPSLPTTASPISSSPITSGASILPTAGPPPKRKFTENIEVTNGQDSVTDKSSSSTPPHTLMPPPSLPPPFKKKALMNENIPLGTTGAPSEKKEKPLPVKDKISHSLVSYGDDSDSDS